MSQLNLRLDGARADGALDLQLPDARRAVGLDPTATGDAAWADVKEREAALRAYVARRIAIEGDGRPCELSVSDGPAVWQSQPPQVTLRLRLACPQEPARLDIRCDLLFDADAAHRAYFSIEDARMTHVGLFRADRRRVSLDVHRFSALQVVADLAGEGARHIWSGLDHVLFLLALLLPAPLVRRAGMWIARADLRGTAREVLKVITAFTVAHSITLGLSFAGLVFLPARLVEVAIALSVFAAAWNNVRPFLPGRAWVVALAFGLVHGLGFAGALRNLSLPMRARGLALAAFNVGVELGQLAIVAAVLPLLFVGAKRSWYPRLVLGAGSVVVAWIALLWTFERATGVALLPRL